MNINLYSNDIFGILKPMVDVHTMGINAISNLLEDCGYRVILAPNEINNALQNIHKINNFSLVKRWILDNGITRLGYSYRLDPNEGSILFLRLYEQLKAENMLDEDGGILKHIFFAGLPKTCEIIKSFTNKKVTTFEGQEDSIDSLKKLGVPSEKLKKSLSTDDEYDAMRWDFAKKIISSEEWKFQPPLDHFGYRECGKENDTYEKRLSYAMRKYSLPIIRTHSGPYNPDRIEALKEYNSWVRDLDKSKLLDVLSIGSSQLTQSAFGEDWGGLANGGGVPINSELEYKIIKDNAGQMLVRTYSGTKDVPTLAKIHEKALNISWHAFSFWWFNELDGRGKNSLYENLKEHFEAVKFAASTNKPVEPNVSHHFAFRGTDDVSYIISAFIAIKACKKLGISHIILQNMLNTPRYISGLQDLAKSRALIKIIRELEDDNFKVSLQTRAGLDYFKPNIEEAKIQLASVTCMMDDIEPDNRHSPEIIHVVNYSEAIKLATPEIIKDSIQITLFTLESYRTARKLGIIPNLEYDKTVIRRTDELYEECKNSIKIMEEAIPYLYSPEGFFKIFIEGFFPVPYLMDQENKYSKAKQYKTAIKNGSVKVVDFNGNIIYTPDRYKAIISQMANI